MSMSILQDLKAKDEDSKTQWCHQLYIIHSIVLPLLSAPVHFPVHILH